MKTNFCFLLLVSITLFFTSCEDGPGEGGTSTIRGKVIVKEYNSNFTIFRDEYPGVQEDVYIIYGDDFVYGDRFETGKDGQYEFNYLRKGTYTVFTYSKDSLNLITNEEIVVSEVVEITDDNQTIEVPDFTILK